MTNRHRSGRNSGLGALVVTAAGLAGAALFYQAQTRNRVASRPSDSAPGRTARQLRFGRKAVVGRTVTIDRPRSDIYAYWRNFENLPTFMENVREIRVDGDLTHWTIAGPLGRDIHVETRIVTDDAPTQIAWQSTEDSDIETQGKVHFHDAPGGRGTQVEAIIAYTPPMGELGRWVAKVFQAEPHLQGRRELKRLKMLLEAGEIATSANRKS